MRKSIKPIVVFIILFKMLSAYLIGGKHPDLYYQRLDQTTKGINYIEISVLLYIIFCFTKAKGILFASIFSLIIGITHFYIWLPIEYAHLYRPLLAFMFALLVALVLSFIMLHLIKRRA